MIPCRYSISEKSAAGLRHIWTLLGQYWTEPAPFLPSCAALPARRLTPPLISKPISASAGEVARNCVLNSPKGPEAALESVAITPIQQRRNQASKSQSHDDAQETLALRAHQLSGSRARNCNLTLQSTDSECTQSRLLFRRIAILGELQRAAACEFRTNCRGSQKRPVPRQRSSWP